MTGLIILGIIALYVLSTYNKFVSLKNKAKNAFANIDVMLKKRYDLIPSLVGAVQGAMKHEKDVLERITLLRNQAVICNAEDEKVRLNNELSQEINQVMIAVEAYPDLKTSKNVLHLQRSISEIEEQLSASRRSYNMSVTLYNTLLEKFPPNIVGKLFSFPRKHLFQATVEEKQMVDISEKLG